MKQVFKICASLIGLFSMFCIGQLVIALIFAFCIVAVVLFVLFVILMIIRQNKKPKVAKVRFKVKNI